MSIYEDLPPVAPAMSRIWQAEVATTASFLNEMVYVIIRSFDPKLRWGPCKWMPRVRVQSTVVSEEPDTQGDTEPLHEIDMLYPVYPKRGDDALVVYDNDRQLWIVCWWPLRMDSSGNHGETPVGV